MLVASAFFVGLAAMVKLASDEATAMQAVLYRSVFSAVPVWLAMRQQRVPIGSPRKGLLFVRGAIGGMALFCYMFAVTRAQIADVMALQQLSPIFVTLLSVWFLKERPLLHHYLFAMVCLVGAFLILRPGRGMASVDASVAMLSALLSAMAYISVRSLTKTEPTLRIVFWFSGVAALLSLPFVLASWKMLSLRANLLLIGSGVLAAVAQTLMTASYRRAPAHVAAAFSYANVPLAYLVGIVLWHERPDLWANLGILLIVVSGIAFVTTMRPKSVPTPLDDGEMTTPNAKL